MFQVTMATPLRTQPRTRMAQHMAAPPPPPPLLLLLLLLLHLVGCAAAATPTAAASSDSCTSLLQDYLKHSTAIAAAPYTQDNMVVFLHVPRTVGRTLESCLFKRATRAARRCPQGYAHFNATLPGLRRRKTPCFVLSTHDDLSALPLMPPRTAVITMLRDPVARVLSTYELAVEMAALWIATKPSASALDTDDVWPHSELIPFFMADIQPKLQAAKAVPLKAPGVWVRQVTEDGRPYFWNEWSNSSKWELGPKEQPLLQPDLNPYDNALAMSLQDFVRHPLAADLLHNGQLLQILGLTQTSAWPKAAQLRACIAKDAAVAEELLQVALKRLETFAFVGTAEQLDASVEGAAAALGIPLDGPAYRHPEEEDGLLIRKQQGAGKNKAASKSPADEELLETPLGVEYRGCAAINHLRAKYIKYASVRQLAMSDRRRVSFEDSTARSTLPRELIAEIRKLNELDAVLHERAGELLARQREALHAAGKLQQLPNNVELLTGVAPPQQAQVQTHAGGVKKPGLAEAAKTAEL